MYVPSCTLGCQVLVQYIATCMCTDQLMSASVKCNISCRVKDIKDLLSYIEQRHNVKAKCTKLNFNSIAEFLKLKEEKE